MVSEWEEEQNRMEEWQEEYDILQREYLANIEGDKE